MRRGTGLGGRRQGRGRWERERLPPTPAHCSCLCPCPWDPSTHLRVGSGPGPEARPAPSFSSALDAPPPPGPCPSLRSILSPPLLTPPYFILSLTLSLFAFVLFSSRRRYSHTYSSSTVRSVLSPLPCPSGAFYPCTPHTLHILSLPLQTHPTGCAPSPSSLRWDPKLSPCPPCLL